MPRFEYMYTQTYQDVLEIESVGNTCLRAFNDRGEEYYLYIHTDSGETEILEYGPIIPDINLLPHSVNYSYKRIEFSESKLKKIIEQFLNGGYKGITQVFEVEFSEIRDNIRDIKEHLRYDD